eukprot:gene5567-11203_t
MGDALSVCIDNSEESEFQNKKISLQSPINNIILSEEKSDKSGKSEKSDEKHQILWEFQRYNSILGWGGCNNFESGDPGRWTTEKEDVFGDTLASVAPPIPEGYRVEQNWSIVVRKRIRKMQSSEGGEIDQTGITDRFGWHYAQTFKSKAWSDIHVIGLNIRRRSWRRILKPKIANK